MNMIIRIASCNNRIKKADNNDNNNTTTNTVPIEVGSLGIFSGVLEVDPKP